MLQPLLCVPGTSLGDILIAVTSFARLAINSLTDSRPISISMSDHTNSGSISQPSACSLKTVRYAEKGEVDAG